MCRSTLCSGINGSQREMIRPSSSEESVLSPLRWANDCVEILDQRRLPAEYVHHRCAGVEEVAAAIRDMEVRGAPAIGVAAAYGFVLAADSNLDADALEARTHAAYSTLIATRPTAVNLKWALDRIWMVFDECRSRVIPSAEIREALLTEARRIHEESYSADFRLSEIGADLLKGRKRILTHCNAGPLATAGYGTAVGVIRSLFSRDNGVEVFADETRPFLQGARLTAWELCQLDIPVTIITDNMAGHLMSRGEVEAVVVGADRVAANGDVANKIGTYSLAVLARANGIPFLVAAPTSTVDLSTPTGADIPIEERDPAEVLSFRGIRTAPADARARHPAFDVTPADLITAIITECGAAQPPNLKTIAEVMQHVNGREAHA
jgi:methylthioribose-1-phosphate isomerase